MNSATSVLKERSICLSDMSSDVYAASVWDTAVTATVPLTTGHRWLLYWHVVALSFEEKVKKGAYSSLQAGLPSPLRELTYHMGSHSVTCHPAEVAFPPLPQPKLVLNLVTPEGCKAELT